MEMTQVRYFLSLCREGNFTRAAKLCGVSQPSLTNGIKALEREIGAALFVRKPAPVRLSAIGVLLKPHFEEIESCARQIREESARLLKATGDETIKVSTRPNASGKQSSYLSGMNGAHAGSEPPAVAIPAAEKTRVAEFS